MLTLANLLWAHGYFYTATLAYLPVQVAIVLAHNSTLLLAALVAGNRTR